MEEKEVGFQKKIADLEVHLLELGKLKSFLNRDSTVIITYQIDINNKVYEVIAFIFHIENERKSIQELKKKVGKRLEKYSK